MAPLHVPAFDNSPQTIGGNQAVQAPQASLRGVIPEVKRARPHRWKRPARVAGAMLIL